MSGLRSRQGIFLRNGINRIIAMTVRLVRTVNLLYKVKTYSFSPRRTIKATKVTKNYKKRRSLQKELTIGT